MVKTTPLAERPRERLLRTGARGLSLREIVAVILGTGPAGVGCLGVAAQVVGTAGGAVDEEASERMLFLALEGGAAAFGARVKGLGPAGRARLTAALELGRRYALYRERLRVDPDVPFEVDVVQRRALGRIGAEARAAVDEWLGFVPVFRNGDVGALCIAATGSRGQVSVEPQELFAKILAQRPAALLLVHNHPSGDLDASEADVELTRLVHDLCVALDIALLGHWIVSGRRQRQIRAAS